MKNIPVVDGFRPLISAMLAGAFFSAIAAMRAVAGTEGSPPTVIFNFADLDKSQRRKAPGCSTSASEALPDLPARRWNDLAPSWGVRTD
jgi:hypothetical protein